MNKEHMIKIGVIFLLSNILLIYAKFISIYEGFLVLVCTLIFFIYPYMHKYQLKKMGFNKKGFQLEFYPKDLPLDINKNQIKIFNQEGIKNDKGR